MHIISDGVSNTFEACFLLLLYVLYVGFVVGVYLFNSSRNLSNISADTEYELTGLRVTEGENAEDALLLLTGTGDECPRGVSVRDVDGEMSERFLAQEPQQDPPPHQMSTPSANSRDQDFVDDMQANGSMHKQELDHDSRSSVLERIYNFVSHPLRVLFLYTIPLIRSASSSSESNPVVTHSVLSVRYMQCLDRRASDSDPSPLRLSDNCLHVTAGANCFLGIARASLSRSLSCIAVCIGYICMLSMLIVAASDTIVAHLGLSQTTVGATLVALGSQVGQLACAYQI
jgi:Ca2+/Na+ antiporter